MCAQDVRQRLNLYWGTIPILMDFVDSNMEDNIQRTFGILKARGMLEGGELIISVTAPAATVPENTLHPRGTAPGLWHAVHSDPQGYVMKGKVLCF